MNNIINYEEMIDKYIDMQFDIISKHGITDETKKMCADIDEKLERILTWLTNKTLSDPSK